MTCYSRSSYDGLRDPAWLNMPLARICDLLLGDDKS